MVWKLNGVLFEWLPKQKGGESLKTVAFISHKKIGLRGRMGWHDGTDGRELVILYGLNEYVCWPEDRTLNFESEEYEALAVLASSELEDAWTLLEISMARMDQIVIFLGPYGFETIIKLASSIDVKKLTFVSCNCKQVQKDECLITHQLQTASMIVSECGGESTMDQLRERFLWEGIIDIYPS